MEQFSLNDDMEWVCCNCGSLGITDYSPKPETTEIYQEVPDGYGDLIEKLVPAITESYINLECNKCHAKEFEAG
ncbi:conserved hypothetical protein [Vibrio crassostreae]|uniref:hypothetical protein n=1 Tax=Vibrio splendidus TaxID=29497 RepID=UPI002468A19B|nr:hypothetical protein [Vibrio splendidus]CAK2099012.1 conserved hypothetical protein [Vibrio crassostreae]MDH5939405.1 hypothetical protein [Vibrio splendidus]CAK2122515.1 conserved hypothetical protein [Vibrio crassostreae]CAK2258210.1 conserved hypothetical protein [Vibrio crassostreae]CAK2977993.1 conserved hypothetical protein [Vibrio crassostreae]